MSSLHPLDAELNLPPEQYSDTLSERVASASAFNGFNQTVEIIKKTTTAQIAKRQVEEIALSSACNYEVSRVLRRFYLFAPFRLAVIGDLRFDNVPFGRTQFAPTLWTKSVTVGAQGTCALRSLRFADHPK